MRTASGRLLGEVRDVLEAPAHEILVVRAPDGADVLIPLVDELLELERAASASSSTASLDERAEAR